MNTLEGLLSEMSQSLGKMPLRKQKLLNDMGQHATEKVKKHTPVLSGELRNSIKHRVKGDDVEVYSDAEYAEAIDKGHATGGSFVPGKNMFEKGLMDAESSEEKLINDFFDGIHL